MKKAALVCLLLPAIVLSMAAQGSESKPSKADTEQFIKLFFDKYGSCSSKFRTDTQTNSAEGYTKIQLHSKYIKLKSFRKKSSTIKTPNTHFMTVTGSHTVPYIGVDTIELSSNKINMSKRYDSCKAQISISGTGSPINQIVYRENHNSPTLSYRDNDPTFITYILLSSDFVTSKKLLNALRHYWELNGGDLNDKTLYEDLF